MKRLFGAVCALVCASLSSAPMTAQNKTYTSVPYTPSGDAAIAWTSGTLYAEGQWVTRGTQLCVSLKFANMGDPATDTADWACSAPGSNLSLTTNGTSGAATLSGGVLNIPQYTGNSVSGSGSDKSLVAVTVAASNSINKANADVQCTGTNDAACINNAIATYCPNDQTSVAGCKVVLQDGIYNVETTVSIDRDDVTLTGEHHCMWGGYEGSWPTSDAVGTGCSQLRATGTGYNIVQINHSNAGGTGNDAGRHRGIDIEKLYIVGDGYTGTGIYTTAEDDNTHILDNVVQHVSVGINANLDSGVIEKNSIQDVGSDAIQGSGVFERIHENLLFDVGGNCITDYSEDSIVSDNIVGDCNVGVSVQAGHIKVVANSFSPTAQNAIVIGGGKRGTAISGNAINWVDALYGYGGKVPVAYPAIDASLGVATAINGNTFDTSASTTYPAIEFGSNGSGNFDGNTFNGAWGSGHPVSASFGHTSNGELVLSSGQKSFTFATNSGTHPICGLSDLTSGAAVYPTYSAVSGGFSILLNGTGSDIIDYDCKDSSTTSTGIVVTGSPVYPSVSNALTLVADYDATLLTSVVNNAPLASWPSTNSGGFAVSANGGARPTYVASSPIGSKPAVYFDGATSMLNTTVSTLTSSVFTVCAAVNLPSFAANGDGEETILGFAGSGYGVSAYFDQNYGNMRMYQGASPGNSTSNTLAVSTNSAACWVFNGSNSVSDLNGSISAPVTSGSNSLNSNMWLGNGENQAEFFKGYIGRIIIYSGAASSSDLAAITSTLRSEFSF